LVSGKKPKFTIFSKECISKFSPTEAQFKQLTDLLPSIEKMKDKFSIFGNLGLNSIQETKSATILCKYCNHENDLDAVFCQNCGNQVLSQIPTNSTSAEIACFSCGAKNKVQALFCKKCGTPFSKNQKADYK
jgi:ribosomal protein L40E